MYINTSATITLSSAGYVAVLFTILFLVFIYLFYFLLTRLIVLSLFPFFIFSLHFLPRVTGNLTPASTITLRTSRFRNFPSHNYSDR